MNTAPAVIASLGFIFRSFSVFSGAGTTPVGRRPRPDQEFASA
jgi:hypothetical protein